MIREASSTESPRRCVHRLAMTCSLSGGISTPNCTPFDGICQRTTGCFTKLHRGCGKNFGADRLYAAAGEQPVGTPLPGCPFPHRQSKDRVRFSVSLRGGHRPTWQSASPAMLCIARFQRNRKGNGLTRPSASQLSRVIPPRSTKDTFVGTPLPRCPLCWAVRSTPREGCPYGILFRLFRNNDMRIFSWSP